MKTSRLAATANPCGATHPCASASTRPALPGRRLSHLAAILCLALIGQTATAASVNLAWNSNPEPDITGYKLSYGTSPGNYSNTLFAGTAANTSVSGLTEGQTYYFVVKAVNAAGLESAPSAEVFYQAPVSGTTPGSSTIIPPTGWTVVYVSSQETGGENGAAINAFDGNPDTLWHSKWTSPVAPPPHDIRIDLGSAQTIQGFQYLPRQDGLLNGTILQYEFYVSLDGISWGTPAANGAFAATSSMKEVRFTSRNARYIWLRGLSDASSRGFGCVAELDILAGDSQLPPTEALNQAPLATGQTKSTTEGSAVAITLSASDVDGDPLSFSVVNGPAMGSLSGTAPNLTYTPAADANGSDSFTFRANDGKADSNTATVSIEIVPTNDAPVAAAQLASTLEDTAVGVLLSASDRDGDALSCRIISSPTKGSLSGTAPNLTYTPNPNANGPDSFSFRANDGKADSNTATVSINISAVNDAPVAASQLIAANAGAPVGIVLSASDADGDPLTFSIVVGPTQGSLSGNPPNLAYTPNPNASGMDSLSFRASDGKASSNTAIVSISVDSTNGAPVAAAQVTSTPEDKAAGIILSASDKDGDVLSFRIISGPSKGSLSGTPPNLTYTPNPNANGTDSFSFRANDGMADSNTAIVSITINPVNDAPVAATRLIAASPGAPVGIVLSASDADGDPLTFSIVGGPVQGDLSGSPPNLTYLPKPDASGSDSFTFRASDGKAGSNTATVSINITASQKTENKAPVFQADLITRASGKTGEIYSGVSLAGSAVDPDGDAVGYSKAAGPEWLAVTPDGKLSGTPPAAAQGLNSFTVRAVDPGGAFDEAVLEITILPTEELPLPWSLGRIGSISEQATAWGEAAALNIKSPGFLSGFADSGLFTWQTLSGDGEITAKISALENANSSSRIGLEIRESLAANAKHVFIGTDGSGSLHFIRRLKNGGSTSISKVGFGKPPNLWLRLVRGGSTISAFSSTNGSNWKRIGRVTISSGASSYIGLMVCGGGNNLSTGIFQNVAVKP